MSFPEEFDVFNCPLSGRILIEASAGTGKTWNIGGLYLRLLLEKQLEAEADSRRDIHKGGNGGIARPHPGKDRKSALLPEWR